MFSTSSIGPVLLATALAAQSFQPAVLQTNTIPGVSMAAVGGGEVFLELSVNRDGRVTSVRPLRTTPPFTDMVVRAVSNWSFAPAEDDAERAATEGDKLARERIETKVLAVAMYRPPALYTGTIGELPRTIAQASEDSAFPLMTVMPPYPPRALDAGLALLQVYVGVDGLVNDVKVFRSAPAFDSAATDAVRQWRFRPAVVRGRPVSTIVYVMFGFPAPIGGR